MRSKCTSSSSRRTSTGSYEISPVSGNISNCAAEIGNSEADPEYAGTFKTADPLQRPIAYGNNCAELPKTERYFLRALAWGSKARMAACGNLRRATRENCPRWAPISMTVRSSRISFRAASCSMAAKTPLKAARTYSGVRTRWASFAALRSMGLICGSVSNGQAAPRRLRPEPANRRSNAAATQTRQ